jgi:hypothetical protein
MSRVLRLASRLVVGLSGTDRRLALFPSRTSAVSAYEEKKVDPALMTFQEFWNLVGGKQHPESAYNWSVAKMNENEWDRREHYPTLLFRRKINGVSFEFRLNKKDSYQDNTFVKNDPDGNLVRINGEIQHFTKEELLRMNDPRYRRYEYSFAVFDGDKKVAVAQDEWGCVLVSVAQEYRKFGLGLILTKMAWEAEPGKTTGGCTPAGAKVTKKAHTEFVRDYLQKGFYSQLIRDGVLTKERVQEIIKSAGLPAQPSKPRQRVNLESNDPRDFLLYAEDGAFIVYDRKLKDLIEQGNEDDNYLWYERFIKGTSFAGGGYHPENKLYLHQLGGDTANIKNSMFKLVLSYAKQEGVPLHVYDDDLNMVNESEMEVNRNLVSLKGTPINYSGAANEERRFRKSFDRYDEFKARVLELAEAKYRD